METNNKLREALMHIQNLADALDLDEPNVIAILDTCRDALAEPIKNCEVGTANEQYQRYEKFCCSHYSITDNGDGNCLKCPFSEPTCKFAWAQMPYEEGDAK